MHYLKVGYSSLVASRALGSRLSRLELNKITSGFGMIVHGCQTRFCRTESTQKETVVIRVPRYLQERVESVKQIRGKSNIRTVKPGKLLIESKNPVLNQSAGYVLGKFEQPSLCSKGWKHYKSFGDYFTVNNVTTVASYVAGKGGADQKPSATFDKFHISKELVETLDSIGITHPTTVQLQAIPKVMKGHNILCAAETGSGKTLCYLLPIVQRLHTEEHSQMYDGSAKKIRALILVPSRELAQQVSSVSRVLCAPFGLVTQMLGGGRGVGYIKKAFQRDPADILVSTPGALVKALRRNYVDLNELNFVVVDEADTMFDPSFSEMLEKILQHTRIAYDPKETRGLDNKAQLLVVGATFPGGVGDLLSQVTDLGTIVVIKSKMLHYLMPHVKQTFLKVKSNDKILELSHALKMLHKEKHGAAALVFCNKSTTVNWLGYSLDELGIQHARLQGEMPAAVRAGIFLSFQKGLVDVLVCTDIASRGLDTSRVHLVINYDFPESQTDYIHRAGRVGRAGGAEDGAVLSFVTHPWDVELVQTIETCARRRSALSGMESEIRKSMPRRDVAEK